MSAEHWGPAPPSQAYVRQALAGAARSVAGCALTAVLGLVMVLGVALVLVALGREAFGEEGWTPIGVLGSVLLVGGWILLRKRLRSAAEAPATGLAGPPAAASPEELAAAHPDEPWLWNEEWASGRLHGRLRAAGALFAILTTAAMVLGGIAAALLWRSDPPDLTSWRDDPVGLAVATLPSAAALLPGMILGGLALRLWLVRRRFGSPVLDMDSVPGVIGGRLQGRVLTGLRRRPDAVRLRLVCSRGAGREIWSAEHEIPTIDLEQRAEGLAVPVGFAIPASCPATSWASPAEPVGWTLRLHATVRLGVDLEAGWVVPVFAVGGTAP